MTQPAFCRRFAAHFTAALMLIAATSPAVFAVPSVVSHVPGGAVYSEPADITQREPNAPRRDDAVVLWIKVGPSFSYNVVNVYYTLDGTDPSGSNSQPATPSTYVLANSFSDPHSPPPSVFFVRNEPSPFGGNDDWWRAPIPSLVGGTGMETRPAARTIRYKISAQDRSGPSSPEVFVGGGSGTVFAYGSSIAWPGAGAGQPNPGQGYPPVYFWKEEAMVGNNWINLMIDQNGTIFDVFYPGAGARYGIGTRNEGYAGGNDTFPPFTTGRGQMNVNQMMAGIRVNGLTHWLSNPNGVSFDNVQQAYVPRTNVVSTSARLFADGNDILVQQYDFCPAGITFPNDLDGNPNRGLYVKRFILTNHAASARTIEFYFYSEHAINGGDGSDGAYADTGAPHGAMIAYDNAGGSTNSRGEYNPTFSGDYPKNNSLFLGSALKLCNSVGSAGGTPATGNWAETSSDVGQGWIGLQVTLQPGVPVEIDACIAGGYREGLHANVGDRQIRPALDWFFANSMQSIQAATENYWRNWLDAGVTIDLPGSDYDALFERGLLATALHYDAATGAVVAGYHNGAYPFCWPRDAVYGAVCLARTGHTAESAGVYAWMRDVCYRDPEPWGRGFWKQKYSVNGYTIWSSPQIDETAVFPWGVWYHYNVTGDSAFLNAHYATVREAALTMSSSPSDPGLLPFLNYNATRRLMWSNNIWEDQYNFFAYSNAAVVRGLDDARAIATAVGNGGDAADFNNRKNTIKGGLDDWLDGNNEITDISQLGLVYPFQVYSPTDTRAVRYIDRMNGVQPDTSGQIHPLVNFTNRYGWLDMINRYWGDSYWGNGSPASPWGAGPWFLSTLWYGLYYAERQDFTAGSSDIDNHKYRIDLLFPALGPVGFGAEQIAPHCSDNCPAGDCPNCGSLLYPGQSDFVLQTAWPNAWESMSTYVDAIMAFLDYRPDAPSNTIYISPKHPTSWQSMTYRNLPMRDQKVSVTSSIASQYVRCLCTNEIGGTVNVNTTMRVPTGQTVFGATRDGQLISFTATEPPLGKYEVAGALNGGAGATTDFRVWYGRRGDYNGNGIVDVGDLPDFVNVLLGVNTDPIQRARSDMNANGTPNGDDVRLFVNDLISGV